MLRIAPDCFSRLLSLESFLAYCLKDALLTGGDLEIALPGGERRNVRQELVELLNGRFAHEVRSPLIASDCLSLLQIAQQSLQARGTLGSDCL